MSKKLPTHGFRWMTDKELENWQNTQERLGAIDVDKLVPNLRNKVKDVIHHQALKQCMELRLEVTRIHRGITFEESEWLKPYIDLNTELLTKATDNFEKSFFKMMNNSVFGKTMENIRNRVNIELVSSEAEARKFISEPIYEDRRIFSENLIAIHVKKRKLTMNKPVYLGMPILHISEALMYQFHYGYIKPMYYDERAKPLFTDTDSLMYLIRTDDQCI